jgi:hypothetical protein
LKLEERVLALTTIDAKICGQIKAMVEKSKQQYSTRGISTSPLINQAFMIHSLPKASQEWQFSVTQTAEKGKGAIATPTTFIDLSKDGINRHCENEIKMTLPSKRSGNGAPMI